MAIIDPVDPERFDEQVRALDERVRGYTNAPGASSYVRAAAHHPEYLATLADESQIGMKSDKLRRKTKELIATSVSMVNGCDYCSRAHSALLKNMFQLEDAQIVELAATAAHFTGLAALEAALQIEPDGAIGGPWNAVSAEAEAVLADIARTYPDVPAYFRALGSRPEHLRLVWERERTLVLGGTIDRETTHMIGLAVAATRGAKYAVRWHTARLGEFGFEPGAILEAIAVTDYFNKNNVFTDGLQLEMGVWGP